MILNSQGQIKALESKDTQAVKDVICKALAGKRSMLNLGAEAQTCVAVLPLDQHAETDPPHEPRIALIFSRTGMCEALMIRPLLNTRESHVVPIVAACP
jgi:hypothetical protein